MLFIEEFLSLSEDTYILLEEIKTLATISKDSRQAEEINNPVDPEEDYFCQIKNNLLVQSENIPF
ncbi:174_t:CDS:2 [Gigaspora margarita]|uniref:174_t:CDS:1 n=1 Tax=Gigaspora margarita TaxID=4874 RepID=A0ABN7UPV5_GIGMA|nr:174_t:CDS:2 [Gigaspora margarita]